MLLVPSANILPGLTETSTVVCSSAESDIWFGTCGSVRKASDECEFR
jgi:hypothetical protein